MWNSCQHCSSSLMKDLLQRPIHDWRSTCKIDCAQSEYSGYPILKRHFWTNVVEDLWKRKVLSKTVPDRKLAGQDGGGPRRICPAVLACIWGRNIEHIVFASFLIGTLHCGISNTMLIEHIPGEEYWRVEKYLLWLGEGCVMSKNCCHHMVICPWSIIIWLFH